MPVSFLIRWNVRFIVDCQIRGAYVSCHRRETHAKRRNTGEQTTANEITIGQQIGILTGYATAHCALGTSMLHGVVTAESEKAIKIEAIREDGSMSGQTVWLPRKAVVVKHHTNLSTGDYTSYTLARWFKPDGYTDRFFGRHVHHSVISA